MDVWVWMEYQKWMKNGCALSACSPAIPHAITLLFLYIQKANCGTFLTNNYGYNSK